jgi:hypothetical protein
MHTVKVVIFLHAMPSVIFNYLLHANSSLHFLFQDILTACVSILLLQTGLVYTCGVFGRDSDLGRVLT